MVIGPGYVYLALPRTGSNAVSAWLCRYHQGIRPSGQEVHHHLMKIPPGNTDKHIWTIVRNPYDRMVSLYYLMTQTFWPSGWLDRDQHGRPWRDKGQRADMTMLQFLEWCLEFRDEILWGPQVSTLNRCNLPVAEFMRWEGLPYCLVPGFLERQQPLGQLNCSEGRRQLIDDLTPPIREVINEHSRKDFQAFNYRSFASAWRTA